MSKYTLGDITVHRWNDWDKAPRATFVGGAILKALGVTAFTPFAAALVGAIVITPIVSWAINALMPKPDPVDRGLLANTRDAAAPQELVYGTVRKGGTITYMESTGDTNKFLHMFICLAGHEVNAIGDLYINDVNVSSSSDYNSSTYLVGGDWNNKVYIRKFLGTAGQNIYSDLSGLSDGPNWQVDGSAASNNEDTNFKGEGIACLYVRLEYDQDVFAEGIPLFTAVVQGKKVLDPRNSTTAFSANAALCIQDYLSEKYGLDNTDYINSTSFSSAANTCDENISLSGGGTEKRYEINGVINLSRTPRDILSDMMTACAGTLFWGQGAWHLKVGEYNTSTKTFTLDDLRGEINLETKNSVRDNFNIVRGIFNDASQNYLVTDYPEIRSTTFIAEDANVENALDFPLPLTTSHRAAQRIAKLTLFRSREQMIVSADFSLEALEVECGDTVALTVSRYGWNAKEFEVISWKLYNGQDAGDLKVHLTLKETSSAVFNWSAEESALAANNSTLTSFTSGLTPSNVTVTDKGSVQTDGTFVGQALVQWTKATNQFLNHYEIEWKPTSESAYQRSEIDSDESSAVIGPLEVGTQYNIRIRGVTVSDVRGSFVSATAYTHGGDTIAPSPVTSLSATGGAKLVTLDWTAPTTQVGGDDLHDLKGYKIYRATTNSQPTDPIAFAFTDKFTDTALAVNTQYYYWVTAVDFTGNESTAVTANATTDSTSSGADTDTRIFSGILYYTTIQASAPSAPADDSGTFSVSSGNFSSPPTGWSHSQTTVSNTSFSTKEWTVPYTVEVDVNDTVQSITYGAVNGAFQITDTIESDVFTSGSTGWRISKDGSAEFASAVIRDTLSVGQIPNLTSAKVTDLGTLATQNSVAASDVSGLGTLATQNSIAAGDVAGLATVATTGSFNNLSDQPTIPTNTNQLTNGAGFQTASDVSTAVANGTSGLATTTALNQKNSVHVGSSGPGGTPNDYDLWYYTPYETYYYYLNGNWYPISIQAYSIATSYLATIQLSATRITTDELSVQRLPGLGVAGYSVFNSYVQRNGAATSVSANFANVKTGAGFVAVMSVGGNAPNVASPYGYVTPTGSSISLNSSSVTAVNFLEGSSNSRERYCVVSTGTTSSTSGSVGFTIQLRGNDSGYGYTYGQLAIMVLSG